MEKLIIINGEAVTPITAVEVTQNDRLIKRISDIKILPGPDHDKPSFGIPLEPGDYTVTVTFSLSANQVGKSEPKTVQVRENEDTEALFTLPLR